MPGATKTLYITDPITAANEAINYTVAIVGCQTSAPVAAVIFKPSNIPSIGVNLGGGGANGAPTYMNPDDIAGVQQQAYWLNLTNTGGGAITGLTGDGVTLPDSLVDSSNNVSTITFDYATSGSWGSGVGVDTPTQRLLNGLQGATGPAAAGSEPPKLAFHNVPPGNHAVLVYAVSRRSRSRPSVTTSGRRLITLV